MLRFCYEKISITGIFPKTVGTEVTVRIGDKTKAGLTLLARQRIESDPPGSSKNEEQEVAV